MNLEERKESLLRLREAYQNRLFELDNSAPFSHCDLYIWKRRHLYHERLEAVDLALHTIERGTYGLCIVCSQPISSGRLKIVPFTTRCFECELTKRKL